MIFFFNDTATTEIYTLSLHDALPIFGEFTPHTHPLATRYYQNILIHKSQNAHCFFQFLYLLLALQQFHYGQGKLQDRKSTRLNSSHANISYAVFCLKKKKQRRTRTLL